MPLVDLSSAGKAKSREKAKSNEKKNSGARKRAVSSFRDDKKNKGKAFGSIFSKLGGK